MKKLIAGVLVVLAAGIFLGYRAQAAERGPQAAGGPIGTGGSAVSAFYDALQPYGEWVNTSRFGMAWRPYDVPIGWRPYTGGHWLDTDDGWAFDADVPWGWATYHYGNWFDDDDYGWCWLPGLDWAPSWVAWRTGDDWIGWAPIPPGIEWQAGVGFNLHGIDLDDVIPSFGFCFVPFNHFCDFDLDDFIIGSEFNINIFRVTNVFIDFDEDEHHHFRNHLPDRDRERIERGLGHAIPRYKLGNADSPLHRGVTGGEARFFRPDLRTKEGADVVRKLPETIAGTRSPELARRHELETQTLRNQQDQLRQTIEQRHRNELSQPPSGIPRGEINQRHDLENRSLQQEMQREQRLLESEHRREERIYNVPSAPLPRRYRIEPGPTGRGMDGMMPRRGEGGMMPRGGEGGTMPRGGEGGTTPRGGEGTGGGERGGAGTGGGAAGGGRERGGR